MDEAVEALFGALGWDKAHPEGPDAVTRVVLGNALSAADAARAVTDEEVVRVLDDNFTRLEALNVLELLQAAGLKVVRG